MAKYKKNNRMVIYRKLSESNNIEILLHVSTLVCNIVIMLLLEFSYSQY